MSQLPAPRPAVRHDGWTAARQREFIATLADTGSLAAAAAAVDMSLSSAYRLRRHAQGDEFRVAWDKALDAAADQLRAAALQRALNGTEKRVWRGNRLVSEYSGCSDKLLIYMLERESRRIANARAQANGPWAAANAVTASQTRAAEAAEFAALGASLDALPDSADLVATPLEPWEFEVHDDESSESLQIGTNSLLSLT